ncbi:MAG: C-GCAxxG-C-C family protein [Desulfurobacteriaceae bacterium]
MEFSKIMDNVRFIAKVIEKEDLKKVDPHKVAKKAYELYWKANCEYGVVNSFKALGVFNFDYGQVMAISKQLPHKWNTICGAITGAFYLFALTLPEELLEKSVKELIKFHNETRLPIFEGNKKFNIPKVAVGSILCRDSIINWCKAAGIHPRSFERSERCARITGDLAYKTAKILNKYADALVGA